MKSYRRAVLGLFLLFCIYTPIAILGGLRGGEYFPVFNWSLFTNVKKHHISTEILITGLGDRTFDPPQRFYTMKSEFAAAKSQDITLWKTLIRYRNAAYHDKEESNAIRRQIEAAYLRYPEDVRYRIVTLGYDVLDRYRTGAVLQSIDMGSFEVRASR